MGKRGLKKLDDEEPKAVKEMKKNKKKQIEKETRKSKDSKKDKARKRKKVLLILVTLIILISGITLGISANTWITLAKDMVSNESSIVIDSDGNTIAKLRRRKKKI